MRARLAGGVIAAIAVGTVAACGFGIDVDSAFSGGGSGSSGGTDGSVVGEASIPTLQVVQLTAGDGFTCGRRVDGSVMCWGGNDNGELGDGQDDASSTPILVSDVTDAVDVTAGQNHACAVRKSGGVACWGLNSTRQLGDGTTDGSRTPKAVLALSDAMQVAAGGDFTCAVRKDATVSCWGGNGNGQLGDNTQTARSQPAPVQGVADALQVAAGMHTACALVKSGEVFCWGDNQYGAVGLDSPDNVLVPNKVAGLTGVKALAGSGTTGHFCALLESGALKCWGYGGAGGLGNGKGDAKNPTPSSVLSVDDAIAIDVGQSYSCAARKGGTVSCWGSNDWRKLGLGDDTVPDSTSSPVPVVQITGAVQIATGAVHACAVLGDGTHVSCWGANVDGRLGRGTRLASEVPVKVSSPASFVAIGVGTSRACGADATGNILCWGMNDGHQLGIDKLQAAGVPTLVPGLAGGTKVSGGSQRTCAVIAGGTVSCWGTNPYGALGYDLNSYENMPHTFAASGPATDAVCGYSSCCALLANGQVQCAGYSDTNGGLGNTSTPTTVPGTDPGVDGGAPPPLSNVTRLAGGGAHTCAIHDGKLTCWGSNPYGSRGPNGDGPAPTDVPLDAPPLDVSGDGEHTCVVVQGGGVRCWGRNGRGETTGSDQGGPSPKTIDLGGKAAKAIAAGWMHTCALVDDGTVRCWGRGSEGQIGNGVRADALAPAVVKDLTDVKAISAYDAESCALKNDGSVWCWGANGGGQLGDGSLVLTGTPGAVVGY